VTNARATYTTRATAGATGTRLSLRPLIFEGHECQTSDASRREKAKVNLLVIASDDGIDCLMKSSVIPGRAKREPGIHTPCRGYGFPDVQLHI
jgi:hypothetical protein